MIKQFNLLLKNKKLFNAFFSQSTIFNLQQACQQKIPINSFKNLKATIQYDTTSQQFLYYSHVNNQFQSLIKEHSQNVKTLKQTNNTQNENFQKSLELLVNYPYFHLDKESYKSFYQIIHENIHQKDPHVLENALTFMIISDPYVQQTKLYEQFARFYVNSKLQVLRSKFSLHVQNENVISSIKKLLVSVYQRGFLPRSPGYIRTLYIANHVLLLGKMIQKESFHNSLMLKRVLYQYFMQIKQYFEHEMKQNLYHEKNLVLIQKLIPIMKVLCVSFEKKIDIIEPQCKQLRQLYIKLFMVIDKPNLKNGIFMYQLIKGFIKKQQQLKQQKKFHEKQNQSEVQKVSQLDKKSIDDFLLLSQFMRKFEKEIKSFQWNIQQAQNDTEVDNKTNENAKKSLINNKFTVQEMLCMLAHFNDLKLKHEIIDHFINKILELTSPLILHLHLSSFLEILRKQNPQFDNLIKIFTRSQSFELLTLQQVANVSLQKFVTENNLVKLTILEHIATVDIKEIGTKEILYLLQVYKGTKCTQKVINNLNAQNQQEKIEQQRIPIINFILRFLADHHKSLEIDSFFQQILGILFDVNPQNDKIKIDQKISQQNLLEFNFNDPHGNYPMTILQEMQDFLNKNLWKMKNKQLKKLIKQKLQQLR